MLVSVKDLKRGDEVIIPSHSSLKYLKVLKDPELRNYLDWNKRPSYKSVRCSIGGNINKKEYKSWDGSSKQYIQTDYEFETDCSKHTIKRNFDLNYKSIWLVKREQN